MRPYIVNKLGLSAKVGGKVTKLERIEHESYDREIKLFVSVAEFARVIGEQDFEDLMTDGYNGDGERYKTYKAKIAEFPPEPTDEHQDRPFVVYACYAKAKKADKPCPICGTLCYGDEMKSLNNRAVVANQRYSKRLSTYSDVCKSCHESLAGQSTTCVLCGDTLPVDNAWRIGWDLSKKLGISDDDSLCHEACYRAKRAELEKKEKEEEAAEASAAS